ncbi:lactose transporter [Thermosipho africanus H17ap60334]|jgi:lactose/L-arabinose transport system permease protein|uniref:Lactose transport system n=1 Tax=Thermosipho africanus (strain TCF52B) TaxID=484019 RepID=B7IDD6_THEAB|nr:MULTISPECIES: sugar ABC transporter permease [Thermosipho]ACJ76013.1 lactose transport system [Thermosipho africanus TCF52B]EKF49577.1 lactose transporter [Thermosipho africanus H17ap60334]MBZ4650503.1 lactose transport system [Thermosipho sp. (in: thermotogales)]MDK2839781.1 lactose/L-arabinose transport system permease protein [Thermosipho sp. (in: thermotogales)]MDK2900608.1 lactose/L-arabinose transport system permease protein [Thermosipho sp. (in: thermotogales)]
MKIRKSENIWGWVFISLALSGLLLFILYPIIYSLYLSTFSTRGYLKHFVGLGNYKRLFQDSNFLLSLKNIFIIFIIQVPIMLFLALIFAFLLNNPKLKFRGFYRTALFLPAVTSLVAYSVVFKMMFSTQGLVNNILLSLHIIKEPIRWLLDPFWAKVTLIIAMTWRWTGYNMMFYLAGLQNIPLEIYEAAEIDGASKTVQFFKITIPLLKPIILFTTIMSTIGTLQLFDEPMNLAAGVVTGSSVGPGNSLLTPSVYIYNVCFKYVPNFGYASAISYIIVLIAAILAIIQFKVAGDRK